MVRLKSAFLMDVCREIKHTAGRFAGILCIVGLGVSFFAGIGITGHDMQLTSQAYFDASNLMDLRIVSTHGLTQRDLRAIREAEAFAPHGKMAIAALHASHSMDVLATLPQNPENAFVCKAHAISHEVNAPRVIIGRLPQAYNEIALEPDLMHWMGVVPGDTIMLSSGTGRDIRQSLKTHTYTLVGAADFPLYISRERGTGGIGNGQVQAFVLLHPSAFAADYFTEVYITLSATRGLSAFGDAYKDWVDEAADALKEIGEARAKARYTEMTRRALEQIHDGQTELAAQALLLEHEYNQAREALLAQERQLQAALAALADDEATLNDQAAQWQAGRARLMGGLAAVDDGARGLLAQRDALDEGLRRLEAVRGYMPPDVYAAQHDELTHAAHALTDGGEQLRRQRAQAAQALADLTAQSAVFDAGRRDIADARLQLTAAQHAVADGLTALETATHAARLQIAHTQAELAEARQRLHDLPEPKWYVLNRNANQGYAGFADDTEKIAALGQVFPLIFYLVAALVCLTAVTRLVDERRAEIGTLKALGYGTGKIMSKYLLYALLPTLLGSLLGGWFGMAFFPRLIIEAYKMMYFLPEAITPLDAPVWARATGIGAASTLAAALFSCAATLRESPSQLLRPKAPKSGGKTLLERVSPVWRRLTFTHKVTVRNLTRYKKRFVMTVVGIGGCTGLLATGFGVKDSLSDISHNQFGVLYRYDLRAHFAANATQKQIADAQAILAGLPQVADTLGTYSKMLDAGTDEAFSSVTLTVPEQTDRFGAFVTLRDRQTHAALPLTDHGAVVSEKFAQNHGLTVGDPLSLKDGDDWFFTHVSAITENYFLHYIYMSREAYEQTFGEAYQNNGILGILGADGAAGPEESRDAVSRRLLDTPGVTGVEFNAVTIQTFDDILNNLNFVVFVLIVSAGALALIVLLNLTSINIAERVRELATTMVLGFSDKEVQAYIFRENAVLTLIGAALGLGFGILLHRYVIDTVEVDMMMFGRHIKPISFAYSVALTFAFSGLVNLLTAGKLRAIDMVEALKSVE